MDKFTQLTGVAAPMPEINIDTDRIIPKNYLKTIKRTGLGTAAFAEVRYDENGKENPDFVLNKPAYRKAQILVTGENFGCGSSREHAPIAIKASGISVVIAKSFARIFYRNAINTGLPIMEAPEAVDGINNGDAVTVDAETGTITNETTGAAWQAQPFPPFVRDIIESGGLVEATKAKLG